MPNNSFDLDDLSSRIRNCRLCDLAQTRHHAVPGEGPIGAEILFVGEAPGKVNDELGRPFVGHGGAVFDGVLAAAGLVRANVFITNAVKCWPPGNRRPKPNERESCRQYLDELVDGLRPRIIFALGSVAFAALTGETIKLRSEHGKIVRRGEILVCAVFHPNGLRYVRGGRATLVSAIRNALDQAGFVVPAELVGQQLALPTHDG